MDVTSKIPVPLSNDLQSLLSSVPPNSLLPSDGYPNRYLNEPNSDINYLNNELDSNTIEALQPSSNGPSFFTRDQCNISNREQQSIQYKL
jgi:hypothetical protein